VAGELVYVNADPAARRGVAWPEPMRARFRAFEPVPIVEERRDAG
jgi:hypothetical protein